MSENEVDERINLFVQRLQLLGAGERARLKRNAGCKIAESRDAAGLFYRLLPHGVPQRQEEIFFLLATLFPVADGGGEGNLGKALRRARSEKNKKGMDRRLEILLDADLDQLPFRLRQAVQFLQSNRIRVNWQKLLADLLFWEHPDRFVQQSWARTYFSE